MGKAIGSFLLFILMMGSAHAQTCSNLFSGSIKLPRGFHRIHGKMREQDAKLVRPWNNLDPNVWAKIIPDYVYTNALKKVGTPFVTRLGDFEGVRRNRPIFRHGTTPQGRDGIMEGTIHLGAGWGAVDTGFFLDIGNMISRTYHRRGGVLLEVFVHPEARVFDYSTNLTIQLLRWFSSPEGELHVQTHHPDFYRLAEGRRADLISRDFLARSFGAQVLMNQTLYGQVLMTEAVILDPSVVLGIREIRE